MKITKLANLFAASTFLAAAAAAPAFATPISDAFVANIRPNVDFLDKSSRLALSHSSSPRVRSFAHSEAIEQTITANSLVAYASTNRPEVAIVPADGSLGPVGAIVTAPVDVAAGVTTGVFGNVNNVLTGRSVAIDNPLVPVIAPRVVVSPPPAPLLPAGSDDLARLDSLSGRSFDALYRTTQMDALRQLATVYRDYMQNGDDDALRAMASRELPKINMRIRELNAI